MIRDRSTLIWRTGGSIMLIGNYYIKPEHRDTLLMIGLFLVWGGLVEMWNDYFNHK